jgi:hypothetical protein
MHFAGVWVNPIYIFRVLVIGKALTAFVAKLVTQIKTEVPPALLPPPVINVEFRIYSWAEAGNPSNVHSLAHGLFSPVQKR